MGLVMVSESEAPMGSYLEQGVQACLHDSVGYLVLRLTQRLRIQEYISLRIPLHRLQLRICGYTACFWGLAVSREVGLWLAGLSGVEGFRSSQRHGHPRP